MVTSRHHIPHEAQVLGLDLAALGLCLGLATHVLDLGLGLAVSRLGLGLLPCHLVDIPVAVTV